MNYRDYFRGKLGAIIMFRRNAKAFWTKSLWININYSSCSITLTPLQPRIPVTKAYCVDPCANKYEKMRPWSERNGIGFKSPKRCSPTNCCLTLRKFSHIIMCLSNFPLFIAFMTLKWWCLLSVPYSVTIHVLFYLSLSACNSTFFHESVYLNEPRLFFYYILNEVMPERNASYHFCDVSPFAALNFTVIFFYKNTSAFPCYWFSGFLGWKY